MIARPLPSEYPGFDQTYVPRVPEGIDIFEVLRGQPDQLSALLQNLWDDQAGRAAKPGEWSIKEVIGHIADTERIFGYRCLRIARGDTTPLPGFEQDDYIRNTDLNPRPLPELIEEFSLHRRANLLCFQPLDDYEIARAGTVSDHPVTVRALLHLMAGHFLHHYESLVTDYGVRDRV